MSEWPHLRHLLLVFALATLGGAVGATLGVIFRGGPMIDAAHPLPLPDYLKPYTRPYYSGPDSADAIELPTLLPDGTPLPKPDRVFRGTDAEGTLVEAFVYGNASAQRQYHIIFRSGPSRSDSPGGEGRGLSRFVTFEEIQAVLNQLLEGAIFVIPIFASGATLQRRGDGRVESHLMQRGAASGSPAHRRWSMSGGGPAPPASPNLIST